MSDKKFGRGGKNPPMRTSEKRPCSECGNSDVRVLQFDHKELKGTDPHRKRFSEIMTSRPKIIEEIAKCDVRCANCHMIRTAEQMGWSRI